MLTQNYSESRSVRVNSWLDTGLLLTQKIETPRQLAHYSERLPIQSALFSAMISNVQAHTSHSPRYTRNEFAQSSANHSEYIAYKDM